VPACEPLRRSADQHAPYRGPLALVLAASIVAAVAFYLFVFVDLFILTEYRMWVEKANARGYVHSFIQYAFSPTSNFSRSTALWLAQLFGEFCGADIPCHNLIGLALPVSTALLLVPLIQVLAGRPTLLAPAGCLAYLVSIPTLDALSWQATLLDKTAALLTAGATLWWIVAVKRSHPAWLVNLVGLLFAIAAYNAKEAAWSLLPSLALFAGLYYWRERAARDPGGMVTAALAAARLLVLPGLYVAYHVGTYLWQFRASSYAAHAFGGDRWRNLDRFAGYLLNLDVRVHFLFAVLTAAMVVLCVAAYRAPRTSPEQTRLADHLAWCLASFLLALVIPSGTFFGEAFYLLVPAVSFYVYTALAGLWVLDRARGQPALARTALAGALAAQVGLFWLSAPPWLAVAERSRNVRALLQTLASIEGPVTIVYPAGHPTNYRFFEPAEARYLDSYVPGGEARLTTIASKDPASEPGAGTVFVLDQMMSVRQVRPGSRR
jgi:hypothetical protein